MNLNKEFAKRLNEINLQDKPSEPIMALGYIMRDWLSVIADKPEIYVGAGMSCFNLWAEVEGQKVFIEIKKANNG